MQADYAAEVDRNQHRREGAVDQRAVDEEVYIVEAVPQDREAHGDRNPREAKQRRGSQEIHSQGRSLDEPGPRGGDERADHGDQVQQPN